MTEQTLAIRVLVSMYRSANHGRILTLATLQESVATDKACLLNQLKQLDRAGYIDASRLRLTLSGLAVAVAAAKKLGNAKRLASAA